jgi:hypothetical protein
MPAELRSRVTSAPGTLVHASADRLLANVVSGTSIDEVLLDRTWTGTPPSYDFPSLGTVTFGLRYAGQLRIEERGPHVFALDLGPDPDDYARVLLDGVAIAGRWPGQMSKLTSDAVDLPPGWHDIVLDYTQSANTSRVRFTMTTPSSPAAVIDKTLLRPVRTSGFLSRGGLYNATLPLVDATATAPGVKTLDMMVDAPAGAIVEFVDVFFHLQNPRPEIAAALIRPSGVDPLPIAAIPPFDGTYDYWPARTLYAGSEVAVPGGWQLVVTDSVMSAGTGAIYYPAVVATYTRGADPPFAREMIYTSPARPLLGTSVNVTVDAELRGAALAIAVRTGNAQTIEAAEWIAIDAGSERALEVIDELIQYRLAITGDGWQYPTVDRVTLEMTAP